MNGEKIGGFISSLRKLKGMTQKELADKLKVTDKAVSKWERGAGYPEITLLPELAAALGISVGELLSGESETGINPKTEEIVVETLAYAEHASRIKESKLSGLLFSLITLLFLIAMFACTICNLAISHTLDWALYPLGSLLFTWLIALPIFMLKKHRFIASLAMLTLMLAPYLLLLEHLTPAKGWFLPLGLPVSALSIGAAWLCAFLFLYTRIRKYFLLAFTVLLFGVVVNSAVNGIVGHFVLEQGNNLPNMITQLGFAFLSAIFLLIGFARGKK